MTRPRVADRRSSGAVVVLFITGGGKRLADRPRLRNAEAFRGVDQVYTETVGHD